jgi:uncharacterized membrane protein
LGTAAASTAAAFYALTSFLLCAAFNLLWRQALRERNVLKHDIPEKTIRVQSRSYAGGLLIYLIAIAFAYVNAWITVGICSATWIFWMFSFKSAEV